jgi:scyllo-inositol 2-dehydrogenase (NADP+)
MKILNTAVVGLGRIGWQFHIPQIIEHEGFRLAAVVDPLEERLEEAIKTFSVHVYKNCLDLFRNENIDLVVIASPTSFHKEQALLCMENGVDVFLEKPMAATLVEADEIVKTARRTKCKVMVHQHMRLTAESQAIKHILAKGYLGPIYMVRNSTYNYTRRNDWQSMKKYGGGMLNNTGVHVIDQLLFLFGGTASKISCYLRKIAALGDAEDVVKAVIETNLGTIWDIDINMASTQEITPWIIFGRYGTAIFQRQAETEGRFMIRYYKEKSLKPLDLQPQLAAPNRSYGGEETIPWQEVEVRVSDFKKLNSYEKCYEYFAEGKTPFVAIEESREVMRILSICHEIADQ